MHFGALTAGSIITNELPGGRFGENVLSLYVAKWVACHYNLPFQFTPFEYSDQLMLHDLEEQIDATVPRIPTFLTEDSAAVEILKHINFVYQINYFTNHFKEWDTPTGGQLLKEEDPAFIADIRRIMQPRFPVRKLELPADAITVAVHVRKGGGFDSLVLTTGVSDFREMNLYADYRFPLKFPPDQFYIDQIQYIADMFRDRDIYVYLFTDDKNPAVIAATYAAALNDNPRITFGYRKADNAHDTNVVEDFFAMTQFDCLIRADSNLSKAVQLLHDFKIVIYPRKVTWDRIRVTEVGIDVR